MNTVASVFRIVGALVALNSLFSGNVLALAVGAALIAVTYAFPKSTPSP